MEYIGNRPPGGPTSNPPPDRWWLQDWTGGSGRDYQDQSFEEAYREFLRQQQQQPQQPNEGQVVNQPQDPTGTAQDPVFSTDVWGDRPPVQTLGYDPNYDLNQYLSSLPGGEGGGTGGTGANFQTTGWDVTDWGNDPTGGDDTGGGGADFSTDVIGYPFPGPYPWEGFTPNPPPGADFSTDVIGWPFPGEYPWPPFEPNRPPRDVNGPTLTTPPRTTQPPPQQPQQPQQPSQGQQQKPGVGPLLAALPMLAAFQGGTTTTPAPYAHLGPHTPVAPVFKPQGRGNPIPSIGQLLAGVR